VKIKKQTVYLALILGLGLVFRLWGINFGLPYLFHQDEPIVVNHAIAYGSGDLNPHFFVIPPLTSYILFIIYVAYYLILMLFGCIKGQEAFAVSFFKDPTPFYLIGRFFVGVLPSVASVYLTYRLGLKFFSKKAAYYAAFAMAFSFLNILNAHYIYTDNFLVMFMLCTYLTLANLMDNPNLSKYIFSGMFIGISIAIKYNAAPLIASLFIAHLLSRERRDAGTLFSYKLWMGLSCAILTFIICNPFSLFDARFFLSSLGGKIRHSYIGWSHHVRYSLFEGFGVFATLLGVIGLCLGLKKRPKKIIFMVSFPALFYLHLVYVSQPFPRYVLVLIPFLCLGLGFLFFDYLCVKFKKLKPAIILLSISIFIASGLKAIKADRLFSSLDTRVESRQWMIKNIPGQSRIALDHTFFRPQIGQTTQQLRAKEKIIGNEPALKSLKSRKLRWQIMASQDNHSYEIYYLDDEPAEGFLSAWPTIGCKLEELKKSNIEYVVFNNMTDSPVVDKLQREIAALYRPVATFDPYYTNRGLQAPYDTVETTCLSVLSKELFSRKQSGPYVIIYKIK